ncbi:hypothetical protein QUC31_002341 [Theobroma cacao]
MDIRFQALPPVKRFRLMQQQNQEEEEFNSSKASSFCLPAKKRKESRDPPVAETTTYCLPAKKRIWALQPDFLSGKPLFSFDLNVEYEKEVEIEENKRNPISKSPKKCIFDAQKEILKESKKNLLEKGPKKCIKTRQEEEENKENEIPLVGDSKKNSLAKSPKKIIFDSKKENLEENKKIPLEKGSLKCMKARREEEYEENEIPALEESSNEEEEDGILCDICKSTDGDPTDPIVFCDGCDLMVHSTCYGNPLIKGIPEGDWFCDLCLASQSEKNKGDKQFSCCLCPTKGGALKPTTVDGKWAHLVCAVLVPEVFFEDPEGRERIDCSKVLEKRWKGKCYICKMRSGCVLECSEPKCGLEFHVTCGLKEDLCIEYKEGKKGAVVAGFCKCHTELWKKQQQTGKFKIVARDEHRK